MAHLDGGRFGRWLEKFFNLKSAGQTLFDVGTTIQPVITVNIGNELRIYEGWQKFYTYAALAQVAAQFGRVQLKNPAGSNVIIIVEKLYGNTNGGSNSQFAWAYSNSNVASLANAQASQSMDFRGPIGPTAVVTNDTNASQFIGASLVQWFQLQPAATTGQDVIQTVHQEMILTPGTTLQIASGVVNVGLEIGLMWRERAMEASELTG